MICAGCIIFTMREDKDGTFKCPFCRTPAISGLDLSSIDEDAEYLRRINARIAAGDSEAINALACKYHDAEKGLTKDVNKANQLWLKAAKMGNPGANRNMASSYSLAKGAA